MKHYLIELRYSIYRIFALKYLKKYAMYYQDNEGERHTTKSYIYLTAISQMKSEKDMRDYKQDTLK